MYDGRIYVSDYLGHRVLVYGKSGRLIRVLGKKGVEPAEFQIPYGVLVDKGGNLYVNDRGNRRVQVFDSTYAILRVIATRGQNEQILLDDGGTSPTLVAQGVTRCAGRTCLLERFKLEGPSAGAFAILAERVVMHTWQATLDSTGHLYIANVLGTTVEVFSRQGKRTRVFDLKSPAMKSFPDTRAPVDLSAMAAMLDRLRQVAHTRIRTLSIAGTYLLVQLQRVNWSTDEPEFVLDVYDLQGHLRYYSIPTPGILHSSPEGLYFVSHDEESGYGSVTIRECKELIIEEFRCGNPVTETDVAKT